jgi:hypothetical protein
MTRSTSDIGLEVLASSGVEGGWAVAAAGAAAAVGLARVIVMCHGTRDAGFKRFLRDRPTFFTTPERASAAFQYARCGGIGAAQRTPCKQKRVDPALLEVAVDPGRIMDLTKPEDVAVLSEIVADLNAVVTDPDDRIPNARRLMERSMSFRSVSDEKFGACTPALPYWLLTHRGFAGALAVRGYDSAWTTEGGYQSLAVLNARDRARILGRVTLTSKGTLTSGVKT